MGTWSQFYLMAENARRNSRDAYLQLSGKAFVTKDHLVWYIDYLVKSNNNVQVLINRCRDLEEQFNVNEIKRVDEYNKLLGKYNDLLSTVKKLEGEVKKKEDRVSSLEEKLIGK